ncbi:MAG: radical SAM protein [Prevotellaceae bacterium]|jgi:uncharacterized protein|nr:radical SAM protein [Prevotellaceae bacterium]
MDTEQYQSVINICNSPESAQDTELLQQLIDNKILVKDNNIELFKYELAKNINRFNRNSLALTIAPTSDCNFKCSYCFENSPEPIYMNEDAENELIKFIEKHNNIESLSITWYGGEPLLAFDNIQSITNKVKSLKIAYSASMITNGYLFNKDNIKELEELKIQSLHITLDGLENIHNRRRVHKTESDSFRRILDNIKLISEISPNTNIIIRVNVDKENYEEYHKLYQFLKDTFGDKITNIYPGFVKKTYGSCSSSEDILLTNKEQTNFLLEQYLRYGIIDNSHFLPHSFYSECIARCINGYLVSPDGYLYKCWTDLGNLNESIGHLSGKNFNADNLAKYMVGGDPFSDKKCRECKFLPVCGGGCPHFRLKNLFNEAKADLCHLSKSQINNFLEIYYEKNFIDT